MDSFDLLIVGGGINGTAIARDAAGRGQSVLLVEKDDLASHTSSASSKLIHGGLRYLEQREFALVRESLRERETLLRTAPHIVRPLRFVLPHAPGMRPWWMMRAALALYDVMAGFRISVGRSRGVRRSQTTLSGPLKPQARRRLATYWDAWVDDARLVVLNAVQAAEKGAQITTRTEFLSARREGDMWRAELSGGRDVAARMLVNAAGPWVEEILGRTGATGRSKARLIKGSHILVPALYEGEHGYILQQPDRRVVFALPFHGFTLIGTTDVPMGEPVEPRIEDAEADYLCEAANRWFQRQTAPGDAIWSFSGLRALYDDGSPEAQAVTRDYRLELDEVPGPRLLSVFGGKITTARALASEALDLLGVEGLKWTRTTALPGGDIDAEFLDYLATLDRWMPSSLRQRLTQAYGTCLRDLLGNAAAVADLGHHHGAGLHEVELAYLMKKEFARTAEDVLWRRTRLGLKMSAAERKALARRMAASPG